MFARHYMKLTRLDSRPINAMPSPPPVFRFAPSPHGYMHLGNIYSALLNDKMAREAGGKLLLRIEDTDTARSRPEFTQAIFEFECETLTMFILMWQLLAEKSRLLITTRRC